MCWATLTAPSLHRSLSFHHTRCGMQDSPTQIFGSLQSRMPGSSVLRDLSDCRSSLGSSRSSSRGQQQLQPSHFRWWLGKHWVLAGVWFIRVAVKASRLFCCL
jgi:hypothetical protein